MPRRIENCWKTEDHETELEKLTALGFDINPYSGENEGFNPSLFAKHVKENDYFCVAVDQHFYSYGEGGFWERWDDSVLRKYMFDLINAVRFGIWTPKIESDYIKALERLLLVETPFNSEKNLINLTNGMLNIDTFELYEHDPEYYSTIRIPVEYDESAECPVFEKYLDEVFEGDKERIAVAQEWYGYALTTEIRAQKALICYGTGANGKGIFTTILSELVGKDNFSSVTMSALNNKFALARLFNKTMNISSENEVGRSGFETENFKAIVGGDPIEAEEKHHQGFNFVPTSKLVFSLNSLPSTSDRTEGFYRRLSLLHFSAYFSEDRRDVHLADKIRGELSGVLNWALAGLRRLRENDYRFTRCRSMEELLKRYKEEQNPTLQFIEECIEVNEDSKTDNADVLSKYNDWAKFNGYQNGNVAAKKFWVDFDSACRSKGIKSVSKHSGNSRFHTGFTLR